jgi:tetratricopeptide (TPR) repeat protein
MNQHITRAQLLMQQSRYELAEEQLRLALAENSEDAVAHAMLAICLLEKKEYESATTEARQAIHCAPDEAVGFYTLAMVMHSRNRLTEAFDAITEAVRIEPWESSYWGSLANIESDRKRWKECLAAAENGLEADADDVLCTNMRALALVHLGRDEEAGATIDAALRKEPDNAVTHANQGWALLHAGEPRKAMEHFREALRLNPELEWARIGIIEAMKARNMIYRWMLSYFLWVGSLPPKVQIGLLLGIVFGNQIIAAVTEAVPVLAPYQGWLIAAYLIFAWMSWVASTLFNLVLRLDPFGRLALNDQEKLDSTLSGCCILAALTTGLYGTFAFWSGDRDMIGIYWMASAPLLGLVIPVTTSFQHEGRRQRMLQLYSVGLLGIIVGSVYYLLQDDARFLEWWVWAVRGVVLSTWLGAGAALVPNRK